MRGKVKRRKGEDSVFCNFDLILSVPFFSFRFSLIFLFLSCVFLPIITAREYGQYVDQEFELDFTDNPQVIMNITGPYPESYLIRVKQSLFPEVQFKITVVLEKITMGRCEKFYSGSGGLEAETKVVSKRLIGDDEDDPPEKEFKGVWIEGDPKSADEKNDNKIFICDNVDYTLDNFQDVDVKRIITAEKSARVWPSGKWEYWNEARLVATIFYEEDDCSDCSPDTFCCEGGSSCEGKMVNEKSSTRLGNSFSGKNDVTDATIKVGNLLEGNYSGNFSENEKEVLSGNLTNSRYYTAFGDYGGLRGRGVLRGRDDSDSGSEDGQEKNKKSRCIPQSLSCNGHANCAMSCNADEAKDFCLCYTGESTCYNINYKFLWTALMAILFFVVAPTVTVFLICYHRQLNAYNRERRRLAQNSVTVNSPVNDLPPSYEEVEEPPPCFCYATAIESATLNTGGDERDGGIDNPGFIPQPPLHVNCTCGRGTSRGNNVSETSESGKGASKALLTIKGFLTRVTPSRIAARNANGRNGQSHGHDQESNRESPSSNPRSNRINNNNRTRNNTISFAVNTSNNNLV